MISCKPLTKSCVFSDDRRSGVRRHTSGVVRAGLQGGEVHISGVMALAVFVDLVAVPDSPAVAEEQGDAYALNPCEPEISAAETVMLAVGGNERVQAWEKNIAEQDINAPWFRNRVLQYCGHIYCCS